MLWLWPSSSTISTIASVDGSEGPLASGIVAVWTRSIPALIAST